MIGQGFVTQFVCLLGCVRVVSAVPASPLVMIARHRSESIILVSEGWGVGGSVGQTSYVFLVALWAAWTSHEENRANCMKNESEVTVGVISAMVMAIVL